MEIVPFADAFLMDAGTLLAHRQRALRRIEPALPQRFEDAAVAARAVTLAWQEPGARGVAARVDGQLVGYLIGAPTIDAWRGRAAWSGIAGHAIAPHVSGECSRDLYAALAPHWLAIGCFAHYALVPATDGTPVAPWYALGFGQEQVHAIRVLTADDVPGEQDDRITIRRATPADLAAVLALADLIARHQAGSPVFAPVPPEARDGWSAGYDALLNDARATLLLALRDGRAIGFLLCQPADQADDDLLAPERSMTVRVAAVRPEEREAGVGRMLTAHALATARMAGYVYCTADWRITNLPADRFWRRQGFRPVAYRLARRIDERISWAHAGAQSRM